MVDDPNEPIIIGFAAKKPKKKPKKKSRKKK